MSEIITGFETQIGVKKVSEYVCCKTGSIIPIYEIPSFHLLTQFVGKGKYINRRIGNVVLRGQCKIYPKGLIPSLFRDIEDKSLNKRLGHYRDRRNEQSKQMENFHAMNIDLLDCLLQHYGIKTQWLDVVDNIWVAIWFAIHSFSSITVESRHHVHITARPDDEWGYIYLLCSDAIEYDQNIPGIYYGKETKLVDLRKGSSSVYLRPHAQHALMLGKSVDIDSYNYDDCVIGIAKISVKNGLDWIGREGLMSIQSLFPPTYFDKGYVQLLEQYKTKRGEIDGWGSIQYISY